MSALGEWGPIVDGGAWLTVDGRPSTSSSEISTSSRAGSRTRERAATRSSTRTATWSARRPTCPSASWRAAGPSAARRCRARRSPTRSRRPRPRAGTGGPAVALLFAAPTRAPPTRVGCAGMLAERGAVRGPRPAGRAPRVGAQREAPRSSARASAPSSRCSPARRDGGGADRDRLGRRGAGARAAARPLTAPANPSGSTSLDVMTAGTPTSAFDAATIERLADLVVGFGANVQPGQIVAIDAEIGKEELTRAIAASAYRHGAKFVDVAYFDLHVEARADPARRRGHARLRALAGTASGCSSSATSAPRASGSPGRRRRACSTTSTPPRAGRDQLPALKETRRGRQRRDDELDDRARARRRRGRSSCTRTSTPDEALATLWRADRATSCRLDEDDPVAAWRERARPLVGAAERMTERRFDALHFEGDGTDLHRRAAADDARGWRRSFETVDGIVHMPNLPTEEIFTRPTRSAPTASCARRSRSSSAARSSAASRSSSGRPRRAHRRRRGRRGAARLRRRATRAPSRLGEVALVDGDGRIGRARHAFFDTLLDENAASHIALGHGVRVHGGRGGPRAPEPARDPHRLHDRRRRRRRHRRHRDGDEVPVLRGGDWQV